MTNIPNISEGLVFMAAGGDPADWTTGIAQILVEEGIAVSPDVWTSTHVNRVRSDRNDLIFGFKDLDVGKLAMWRLKFRHVFDVVWLSDYRDNYTAYTTGGMV